EVLPALGYLHSRGLVYCDFKPDNVIQTEEQLKLIDMGGVRRVDDDDSAIYGTIGYQAPEIADEGPSPSSDLYTVGRALAVLTFEFNGYQSTYEHSLPDPSGIPVLAENESFLRAVRHATNPDPDNRFESAAEMADQLTGVLREVLAVADRRPRPAFSTLFSPEIMTIGVPAIQSNDSAPPLLRPSAAEVIAGLPVPHVERDGPGRRLPGHARISRPGAARRRAVRGRGRPAGHPAGRRRFRRDLARPGQGQNPGRRSAWCGRGPG